jgi:hypothetical protein
LVKPESIECRKNTSVPFFFEFLPGKKIPV